MLRIIAGTMRGRRIQTPLGRGTRPTADQVREGLFNTLANLMDLDGILAWDLYAGSGALGIETLSRGAAHVTFVEKHPSAAAVIRGNLSSLKIEPGRHQVIPTKVERFLSSQQRNKNRQEERIASPEGRVDLVLMDPPYADSGSEEVLAKLAVDTRLGDQALIVVECAQATPPQTPPGLEPLRVKRYGDTQIFILGKSSAASHPGDETDLLPEERS